MQAKRDRAQNQISFDLRGSFLKGGEWKKKVTVRQGRLLSKKKKQNVFIIMCVDHANQIRALCNYYFC